MTQQIFPVKGTRDFYPEEMALRSWLYERLGQISARYGYREYEGPLLEPLELYAAKSGEELVKEQAFVFPDKSGDLIALRPELTPTLARMVAQRQGELTLPLRWWSFGPMWRYERPQRGRGREFFQWNIDLIGVDTPEADAEIAAVGASFLQEVGLTPDEVLILVNNRRLMDSELAALDIPAEQRSDVFRVIDRRDKLSDSEWRDYAAAQGLSADQITGLITLLENDELYQRSEELERFFAAVQALGVEAYMRFDPNIIRGLDYYTGTVFECRDRDGEFRAILGGGRYDNLVADVGGDPLPGVGFAMGDMVLFVVLEKFGHLPETTGRAAAPVLMTVFDHEHMLDSLALSAELRAAGLDVMTYQEPDRLGKQFRFADRMEARIALILGPEEKTEGTVSIKNLRSREQITVPRPEAATAVRQMLARQNA